MGLVEVGHRCKYTTRLRSFQQPSTMLLVILYICHYAFLPSPTKWLLVTRYIRNYALGSHNRSIISYAKTMKKPGNAPQCLVRSPPGVEKLIDPRCRATIGIVPNPNHGARKRSLAGQSRWLGRRPTVRGVAMNPVDHPHGGGEGRTKGGRPSVSPWGNCRPAQEEDKIHSHNRH